MTRIKKTRTEKSIGAAKKPLEKLTARKAPLVKKKGKGRPAGAKANIDGARKKSKSQSKSNADQQDLRVGSKKAIALVVTPKKEPLQPKVKVIKTKVKPVEQSLTPAQEFEKIEADERLNNLLDQLDNDDAISSNDQAYVDQQTERYQQLMVELGMVDDEDEDETPQPEQDIWERFDNSQLDDYRDKE